MAYATNKEIRAYVGSLRKRRDLQQKRINRMYNQSKPDSTTQKGDTLAVDWDTKAKIN